MKLITAKNANDLTQLAKEIQYNIAFSELQGYINKNDSFLIKIMESIALASSKGKQSCSVSFNNIPTYFPLICEYLGNIGYKISLQLPDERLPTDTTTLTLKW